MNAAGCLLAPKLHHVYAAVTRYKHASHASTTFVRCVNPHRSIPSIAFQPRYFSTAGRHNEEQKSRVSDTAKLAPELAPSDKTTTASTTTDPKVHHVADDQLPSHRRNQQWSLSRRFHALMDRAMAQLALASQRINNYTGTDYSGIELLRREIADQEQLVRARYDALQQAKTALNEAQEKRTTSATDLVALLERKHSWSGPDLEKYMALVRSEHTNDKAVQMAKESMDRAEQALEDARIRLEKRERAQYHEEQIWSDTIRRNSTWVTIGLMGLNIFILLFNLVAIEPWRRRRLVREVRSALEEKSITPADVAEVIETAASPEVAAAVIMAEAEEPLNTITPEVEQVPLLEEISISPKLQPLDDQNTPWRQKIKNYIKRFFSDKVVSMQMIELTAMVMQAAAGGATVAWLLVLLMLLP